MAGDQDPLSVVRLLAENEQLIANLYAVYAERFPEHADFWSGLAAEERDHARWLRELGSRVEEGTIFVNEDRFRREPIRVFREYLEGELRQEGPMPLARALSIALSTEQALIERRFFEVFETDAAELKHILHDLASATEEHVKKVRDLWAEHKE